MIAVIEVVFLALCAFWCIFLYLIFPSVRKHPDKECLQGLYIAHRGLHGLHENVPENSLPAISRAVAMGYPVEIDIRLTADKEVVVFHDATLKRMCGCDKKPEECTLSELKKLRLKGTRYEIPTLRECLQTVSGKVPLLIEFKCTGISYKPLCMTAERVLSGYQGQYFIQSFYPFVLWWYRKNRKDIVRGQLASRFKNEKNRSLRKRLLGCLIFNFLARPDFVAYEYIYEKNIFRRLCCALGAIPLAWTFRRPQELDKYKKYYKTWIFENFIPVIKCDKDKSV